MSASIHMHIEVKQDGEWYHYAAPSIYRHGIFFDLLAGIYGKYPPITTLRGLPGGLSFVTVHDWKQDSGNFKPHHVGWLSAVELDILQERLNSIMSGYPSSERDLEDAFFHTYMNGDAVSDAQGWDDVRLIFWFDN